MNKFNSKLSSLLIGLLVAFNFAFLFAQDPASYFPSQVGNLWQYRGDVNTNTNWRISRDSIVQDGSRILFNVYPQPYGEQPIYKVDSSNVYEAGGNTEWGEHIYKLDADSGDVWVSIYGETANKYGWVSSVYNTTVFGKQTTVKVFRLGPIPPDSTGQNDFFYIENHLASGFGLIYEWEEPGYVRILNGCVVNGDTFGTVTSVEKIKYNLPEDFVLKQNYPNPFNSSTVISYYVKEGGKTVAIRIFDILGRLVKEINTMSLKGNNRVIWNGTTNSGITASSGVYIYSIIYKGERLQKKLIYLK